MNIGGTYGKVKEQETDVLRGWKRLDLPFKVGYPHRPRRTRTWIRRLHQEEELECAGPRSLSELLVEARGISTCGSGDCVPGDFKH